jgi:hypothetical protein
VETMRTLPQRIMCDLTGIVVRRGNRPRRPYFSISLFFASCLIWTIVSDLKTYGATPASGPAASAASVMGKDAELNGAPMAAGATLFPGDIIRMGEASTAALRFGNGFVLAAPFTELVVESEGVGLRGGRLQVRARGEEPFAVSGPFFHVKIAASEGTPSSAEISLSGLHAQVSAVAGTAALTATGTAWPYKLHAGETANLDAAEGDASAVPQATPNPAAGQVSRLMPQVQIDRGSQHLVAAVSDSVFWNDELRSGPTGRAHVTLKDGSQLNLGSDSTLRILQHDAQSQQTSLDLLVGRMRGKITKLSRPGAKFEVRTPMGIAGLVGTDFSLLVTNDYTELMVIEGVVRFTALNGQIANVTAGNILRISMAGVFEGPSHATPQELQAAQSLTDITVPAGQATVAAATRPLLPVVITVTGTAAAIGIGVWQGTRPTVSGMAP